MRCLIAVLVWFGCVSSGWAQAAARVDVECPAVDYDDDSDRGRDVPDSPERVVLMVVAKVTRIAGDKEHGPSADLHIEEVLFGSPPGKVLRVDVRHASFPEDAERVAYVYGLTLGRRRAARGMGKSAQRPPPLPRYELNGYFFHDRTYPLSRISYARALAEARRDTVVLGASQIVVARRRVISEPQPSVVLDVERSLFGDARPGDALPVRFDYARLEPPDGDGSFVYFVTRGSVTTRWSLETIGVVEQSLGRRNDYPTRDERRPDDEGVRRIQEITLRGPRSVAIEMLDATNSERTYKILAARRLLHDDAAAIPDVVAAIERRLWLGREDATVAEWTRQSNLIRVLGQLERNRMDGHVVRLIEEVLTKAESGAPFPGSWEKKSTETRVSSPYGIPLVADSNHSLAWLLMTLDESAAAARFGARLRKLRDVAAYGWKDEAQYVIDIRHLDDQTTLAEVGPRSAMVKPVRWTASCGDALGDDCLLAYSSDGQKLAAVGRKKTIIWETRRWEVMSQFASPDRPQKITFTADGRGLLCLVATGDEHPESPRQVIQRSNVQTGVIERRLPFDGQVVAMGNGRQGPWLVRASDSPSDWEQLDAETLVPRRTAKLAALHLVWADKHLWAVQESRPPKAPPQPRDGNPFGDPFDDGEPSEPGPAKKVVTKLPGPGDFDDDPFGAPSNVGASTDVLTKRRSDHPDTVEWTLKLPFRVDSILLSGDESTLVVASRRQVVVVDVRRNEVVGRWSLPVSSPRLETRIAPLALSHDGQQLVVGAANALPRVLATTTGKPVHRLAMGAQHGSSVTELWFEGPEELRTKDQGGRTMAWSLATLSAAKEVTEITLVKAGRVVADDPASASDEEPRRRRFDVVSRRRETQIHSTEDGRFWYFHGMNGGKYERFQSFEIYTLGKEPNPSRLDADELKKIGRRVGELRPQWGAYEWIGLVPGGEFLHVGAQVFSRDDLQPVSAVNVVGKIEDLQFSADGRRYLILTLEEPPLGDPSTTDLLSTAARRPQRQMRLRVQETRTGKTLFAFRRDEPTIAVAISSTGRYVAALDNSSQVVVWSLDATTP